MEEFSAIRAYLRFVCMVLLRHFLFMYRKILYSIPDVDAVDQYEIFQPNFFYGVFLVHPTMGRLMRWVQDDRGYGVGQAG